MGGMIQRGPLMPTLPDETLLQIFEAGCDQEYLEWLDLSYAWPCRDILPGAVNSHIPKVKAFAQPLLLVCRRWSGLIKNASFCWVVELNGSCQTMMKEANRCDVDVFVDYDAYAPVPSSIFAQEFRKCATRCRSIVIHFDGALKLEIFWEMLNQIRSLPRLVRLLIFADCSTGTTLSTLVTKTPLLVALAITGIDFEDYVPFSLNGLRLLHFRPIHHLSSGHFVEDALVTWKSIETALSSSLSSLTRLSTFFDDLSDGFQPPAYDFPLVFERLTSLRVEGCSYAAARYLLRIIRAPRLQSLHFIRVCREGYPFAPLGNELNFVHLRELAITGGSSYSGLTSFLRSVKAQNLSRLQLDFNMNCEDSTDVDDCGEFPSLISLELTWADIEKPGAEPIHLLKLLGGAPIEELQLSAIRFTFRDRYLGKHQMVLPHLHTLRVGSLSDLRYVNATRIARVCLLNRLSQMWMEEQRDEDFCLDSHSVHHVSVKGIIFSSGHSLVDLLLRFPNIQKLTVDLDDLIDASRIGHLTLDPSGARHDSAFYKDSPGCWPHLDKLRIIIPDGRSFDGYLVDQLKAVVLQRQECGVPLRSLKISIPVPNEADKQWFTEHINDFGLCDAQDLE